MTNCKTNFCGSTYSSTCVYYTGSALQGLSLADVPVLDDVLIAIAAKLDNLKISLDISAVDKKSFAFDPLTDAQKIFFQETINKISSIETEIGTLQTTLNNVSASVLNTIANNIDLKCLVPNPNPCGGVYTLGQVLQLIINKLCP